ncbi:3-keto-5-aminohexanoate cleavage protein [Streptomyces sp. NRRL F-5650]|uniref:3-keto-5-aminohexanoate cleavage protein n=1 Tax=Streptomyces sp. NRRL F-5650 TaxID=1463868 RepID=UPI0004C5FC4C|nr:3-keto-5-aminohexanoate cleavage protein [Streptomyces sp. NRRL F-5650]
MVQVCVNGARGPADGAVVPLSPDALADSAAEAVAAGATDVHVHPKTPCGRDTLSPRVLAAVLEAMRARLPAGVPVGVTTGAWAEPGGPAARVARIRSWTVLPDHASVNWHEPGAEETAAALLERGVAVEAGIWSGTDGAARFLRSPLAPRVLRVLAEVTDTDPATAPGSARVLLAGLGAAHGRPVLLHGEDGGAWPVLRLAGRLGLATRTGLEDSLFLPDGSRAASNAELVTAAVREWTAAARGGA